MFEDPLDIRVSLITRRLVRDSVLLCILSLEKRKPRHCTDTYSHSSRFVTRGLQHNMLTPSCSCGRFVQCLCILHSFGIDKLWKANRQKGSGELCSRSFPQRKLYIDFKASCMWPETDLDKSPSTAGMLFMPQVVAGTADAPTRN